MRSTDSSRSNMTTRSRTVQPRLKERAEQFLTKADASQTSSIHPAEISRSRKRKLHDVGGPGKPAPSDIGATQKADPKGSLHCAKPTKKSAIKAPKSNLPEEVGKNRPASLELLRTSEVETTPSLSTQKSTKKSAELNISKESHEKRLRRYRKQAPRSFLQKLYRSQTQR